MLTSSQNFVIKFILLIAIADHAASQRNMYEDVPSPITECARMMVGGPDTDYYNMTLQMEGLCDENDIDFCHLEDTFTTYFNDALDCVPSEKKNLVFDGGYKNLKGYGSVLITNFEVTKKSRKKCEVEIVLTSVVGSENGGTTGGECGSGCSSNTPSSSFPWSGGGFRRHLRGRALKTPKSTKAAKNDQIANDVEGDDPCGDPLLISTFADNNYEVQGVTYLAIEEVWKCDTLWACVTPGCSKPPDDICDKYF